MKKLGFILVVLQFCSFSVFAVEPTENVAVILQKKLNEMHTMKAYFSQVVRAKNRTVSRSSGTMALLRPGKFRWETTKPMKQVVIADGKQLWIYEAALEQVTVSKQAKFVGGPAGLFLSDYNYHVGQEFKTKMQTDKDKTIFDLQSKSSKANFMRVKLIFRNRELHGIVLYDQLGQVTDVKFSDIKTNMNFPSSYFKFKPPRGVDVIRQ